MEETGKFKKVQKVFWKQRLDSICSLDIVYAEDRKENTTQILDGTVWTNSVGTPEDLGSQVQGRKT